MGNTTIEINDLDQEDEPWLGAYRRTDFLNVFSYLPRDLNLLEHTSNIWLERVRMTVRLKEILISCIMKTIKKRNERDSKRKERELRSSNGMEVWKKTSKRIWGEVKDLSTKEEIFLIALLSCQFSLFLVEV